VSYSSYARPPADRLGLALGARPADALAAPAKEAYLPSPIVISTRSGSTDDMETHDYMLDSLMGSVTTSHLGMTVYT
jgi:hypothetical protein